MSETAKMTYTCIIDLEKKAKINFVGKEPRSVYARLPDMKLKSETAKKQGDDETAYIMLKRWLNTVLWLKRTPDSKEGKSIYTAKITLDQINEVKNILADLTQKLEIRYERNSKKHLDTVEKMEVEMDKADTTETYASSTDIGLKLPETPTDDPLYGDSDKFISCIQLYNLVQKRDSKYLIIDIREKVYYDNSRIISDKCINIPQSEIQPGLLAFHFLKYLRKDKHSTDLFNHRSSQYVDIVILLDWHTTQESLTAASSLNKLKDILENWDPGTNYKKIKILNGGYQEWLIRYPPITTNSNVNIPEFNNVENEILVDQKIDYPELIDSDEEEIFEKVQNTNSKKLNNTRTFNNMDVEMDHGNNKSTASKHTRSIDYPELMDSDEEEIFEKVQNTNSKKLNNTRTLNNMDVEMDHGDNKSTASKHTRSNSNDIISSAKSFTSHVTISIDGKRSSRNDITNTQRFENSDVSVSQHKISSSKMPQNEVSTKPVIDRSSKPPTLKTSDPRCKEVLKFMKELNELAKSKTKLADELFNQEFELYSQRDDKYSASDKKYLRGEIKSLKVKLEDMHKMYLKVENEYNTYCKETDAIKFNTTDDNEKKNFEFNLSMLKKQLKDIETKRKKLHDNCREFMEREHKEITMKQNDGDVHKEPLKTDGSSINTGLERSYSSPNLLQHPGITGLKNLGNSCYMNSIIQCLSNTTNLAKYFTDNSYADDLNTSNDNMTQGQVVEEVAQVIKALWRGQYKSISPHDLKVAVGQYKLQFVGYEQQDSHEFLTFLLDWMHNDLKKEAKMPFEMTNAEKEWDKAMNSQRSIISDLFFGQLRSTITCSFCKQASTTYETFNSLTMSLSQSNRCTLNDCMDKFVTGQKVSGWKCPKCQTPRDAMKKFDFVKLAPIVVIHLNRFAESGGWLEKRNTAVDFPFTGFNLKPYLVAETKKANMTNNIRNYNYTLYAMSNHFGTMDGGHYTAFCKNATQNKWYKYDDQTVTEVSPSLVKSQNASAYLLFYTSFPNTIM
ncbi:ubiquitin carboxyl-terminal hydrolase 8-like isoform X2 [Linepithema humile]|uniref:ubiquitin carboxyl-terminal hydrolase 8-like isoform X2 n=1 Tax=Linepithema humile TaxID=83485 RepID=UPI00351F5E06